MKRDVEEKIILLENTLTEAKVQKSNTMSIDNMFLKALEALSNIKSLSNEGDALTKREELGSIFHEKLRFNRN
jgi:hypothetical protein